jgi:16S rRNA (cytosine1402-N4)-methyltransferase
MRHVPVLLKEVIAALRPISGQTFVDCTLGDAGHAEAILEAMNPNGKLIGFDADPEAIIRAKRFLGRFQENVVYVRSNFTTLSEALRAEGVSEVNGILIDLGWSTPQFAERGRGFSFQNAAEPLDMRYSGAADLSRRTASEIVNTNALDDLERIFRDYGEENLSSEIAQGIGAARSEKPIETVGDLVEIILKAYRKKLRTEKEIPWIGGLHPATKVFQALRIEVNGELDVIKQIIPACLPFLRKGGRLAMISFHSLEDRIIKHVYKDMEHKGFKIITKKPIECSPEEWESNPPSRSAKLRVIEKL